MKKPIQFLLIITILFTYMCSAFAETTTATASVTTIETGSAVPDTGLTTPALPVPTDISAGASILIDSKTGQVLFEQDSKKPHLYPASTTKMLTGALACEKGDMDQVMTASLAAVNDIGKDGMNIGIMAGEEIKLGNLLDALLVTSANETANIIAENLCSTRQEFVDMMNAKAAELGCEGTHFVNPCGAHDPNHYTTAADMAKMARYAMSIPKFREYVKKISYQLPPTNKHTEWPVLYTTNKLLRYPKKDAPYTILGIKTGYTGEAGNNLISAAQNAQGLELIAVVMDVTGDNSSNRVVNYSRELFDYGFSNFSEKQLLQKGQVVQSISLEDAASEQPLDLIAADDFRYVAKNNAGGQEPTGKPVVNTGVKAPVNEGDVLGYMEYSKDGQVVGKVDLVAATTIEKKTPTPLQKAAEGAKNESPLKLVIILAVAALVLFFLLRIVLRQISRQKRARRYKY